MLIYVKIIKINLKKKSILSGRTHVQLKTIVRNLTKLFKKMKMNTQIHTQKLNFFFILNNLIRNLQNICETQKPKTLILKKLKTQTQT